MYKKTLVSVGIVSSILAFTGCSSTGNNSHLDKYFESPLISKPVDSEGLKNSAKQNSELLVKNKIGSKDFELKNYNITIDGKSYKDGKKVDLKDLGGGGVAPTVRVTDIKETFDAHAKGKKVSIEADRKAYLYQQKYSIVGSLTPITHKVDGNVIEDYDVCKIDCDKLVLRGERTQVLPTAKASYTGIAWTKNATGNPDYTLGSLNYEVDFDKKEGSGKIDGADGLSNITLEKSKIVRVSSIDSLDKQMKSGQGIVGVANQGSEKGEYSLGFFGDKAQEIAGYVNFENKKDYVDVAFSGVKK